jgi:hypothetical protein
MLGDSNTRGGSLYTRREPIHEMGAYTRGGSLYTRREPIHEAAAIHEAASIHKAAAYTRGGSIYNGQWSSLYGDDRVLPTGGRGDHVLIAQLRSGHCAKLAAYSLIVNPSADPTCPRCVEVPQDVEHWLTVARRW